MAPTDASANVSSGVSKLSLKPTSATKKGRKAAPVADSWEDEDMDSGSDTEGRPSTPTLKVNADDPSAGTQAPPPTPISPNYNITASGAGGGSFNPSNLSPGYLPGFDQYDGSGDHAGSSRRPEKTDAVARRMIAGALGVRAPKQSDEQKAYDKAIREKERKRREDEKERERQKQAAAEDAKKAAWGD